MYEKGEKMDAENGKLLNVPKEAMWLHMPRETMLLFGKAKVGKTWAYCSIIEDTISKGGKVFIINTDNGVARTFKQYFGDKTEEISKSITYYFVSKIEELYVATNDIISKVTPKDLVVVDLLSQLWNMAQNKFINDLSNNNPINYIIEASKDGKKFGNFAGSMWQHIRSVHDMLVEPLVIRAKCNILGVCSEKDTDIEKAFTGKVENKDYEDIGSKPAGAPRLEYDFNTVIFIGEIANANRRYFRIIGDRGTIYEKKNFSFDRNFLQKFREVRKV